MARRPRGEGPHYVDLHVGGRIRSRRKALRLSLEALAAALGITHQQMQKYETGGNRITVPTLYEIAGVLEVWVGDFFEGLPHPAGVVQLDPEPRDQLERLLASPGGADLMAAFIALPAHLQRPLVAMATASVTVEQTHAVGDADDPSRR
jgi:transcriptional regulator with XRE-family HTH domain